MFLYHFSDSEKLSSFVKNQHYFELYRSGIAIFKDYPFFGVGNKNYRVVQIPTKLGGELLMSSSKEWDKEYQTLQKVEKLLEILKKKGITL